jgi:hypothetical protein
MRKIESLNLFERGRGFELGGDKYGRTIKFPIPVAHHTREGR